MKRIALLTDGWKRLITAAWASGMMEYIRENHVDANVEEFHSWGNSSKNAAHKHGEYNIFTLPHLENYDGIVVDVTNIEDPEVLGTVLDRVRACGVPAVALCYDAPGFYYVGVNGWDRIREFVQHLYEKHGCRTFHFAGGPKGNYENEQRVKAFRDMIRELGLPESAGTINYGNYDPHSGQEAVRFLCENGKQLPDAIVCANDNIAISVITEVEKLGYRVPEDVKVTGFDNFGMSRLFRPQLTTASVVREEIGYKAVEVLERIWKGETPEHQTYLDPKPLYGESCGCPNDQSIDYREYLRNEVLREMTGRDQSEELSEFKAALHECDNPKDLVNVCVMQLEKWDMDGYAILLDDRIYDPLQSDSMIEDGWSEDRLQVVSAKRDGVRVMGSTKEKLRTWLSKHPGGAHLFTFPLHIEEFSVGFVILYNPRFLLGCENLYDWQEVVLQEASNLYFTEQMQVAFSSLQNIYNKDQLTGVYARTALQTVIAPAFGEWQQNGGAAVLFLDADQFKELIDNFGHDYGDEVLRSIAAALLRGIPGSDCVCRYGGDEFLAVFPCESLKEGRQTAREIEARLMDENISVSIGVATTSQFPKSVAGKTIELEGFIKAADNDMYRVKQMHHNA